jgi:hypothetical protein
VCLLEVITLPISSRHAIVRLRFLLHRCVCVQILRVLMQTMIVKQVPVRKFSRGDVIRNKMSKSLLHSRKSQMLAENEQVPSGDLR